MAFSPSEEDALLAFHLPWGVPHSGDLPASLTLLHHVDHVTGKLINNLTFLEEFLSFAVETTHINLCI